MLPYLNEQLRNSHIIQLVKEILSGAILALLECSKVHCDTLALLLGAAKTSLQLPPSQRTEMNVNSATSTAGNLVVSGALLLTA